MKASLDDLPAPRLALRPQLREALATFARLGYPAEACGLLVGRRGPGGTTVERVTRGRNLEARGAKDRFTLDPLHLMEVETGARAEGLDVVGAWHSHPDCAAVPSARDTAGAWAGWSHVIVSVGAAGAGELRSWRIRQGAFEEELLTLHPSGQPNVESLP